MNEAGRGSAQEAAEQGGGSSDRTLTIGKVVALLQPEFPDLSITKVRYLEDRGLLSPERSPGGYRKYSLEDVRLLRTILRLQRDEYLPLEVIRQRLDRAAALTAGQPPLAREALPLRGPQSLKREEPVYGWQELSRQSGCSEAFLRSLVEYRLLQPAESVGEKGALFTEGDVEVARICRSLARFGLEPRNLRLLASSVERESAVVMQLVTPFLRSTHRDRREYGEELLKDLAALYAELMRLLLFRELGRAL